MASLGEPLITKETWTNDVSRLSLTAIRAVLSLLYDSELMICFSVLELTRNSHSDEF